MSVEPSIRPRLEMDDDLKDSTPSGARAACVPLTRLTPLRAAGFALRYQNEKGRWPKPKESKERGSAIGPFSRWREMIH